MEEGGALVYMAPRGTHGPVETIAAKMPRRSSLVSAVCCRGDQELLRFLEAVRLMMRRSQVR